MILTWNDDKEECVVANQNQMMKFDTKPDLDFNFDSLYVKNDVTQKEVNKESYKLTKRELKLCLDYIRNFGFPEVTVNVVAEDGFYKGNHPIGSMLEGEAIVESVPPSFDYIWENNTWEKVVLIVDENGLASEMKINQRPSNIAIVFTESNKPYRMPKDKEIWDFKLEEWRDLRSFVSEKTNVEIFIRDIYDSKVTFDNDNIKYNEKNTFSIQLEEAKIFKKNKKSKTAFLDSIIEGADSEVSKESLVAKILEKDLKYRKSIGKIYGRQMSVLKEINKLKTLDELDNFRTEFQEKAFKGEI